MLIIKMFKIEELVGTVCYFKKKNVTGRTRYKYMTAINKCLIFLSFSLLNVVSKISTYHLLHYTLHFTILLSSTLTEY